MNEWWILINNKKVLTTFNKLEKDIEETALDLNSLVWQSGMEQWKPIKDCPEFSNILSNIPPPIPNTKQESSAPTVTTHHVINNHQVNDKKSSLKTEPDIGSEAIDLDHATGNKKDKLYKQYKNIILKRPQDTTLIKSGKEASPPFRESSSSATPANTDSGQKELDQGRRRSNKVNFKSFFGLDQPAIGRNKFIVSNLIAQAIALPWCFFVFQLVDMSFKGKPDVDTFIYPILVIWLPLIFLTIWVVYGTASRRLADIGHSGNLVLLYLVPYVGLALVLYLAIKRGQPDLNTVSKHLERDDVNHSRAPLRYVVLKIIALCVISVANLFLIAYLMINVDIETPPKPKPEIINDERLFEIVERINSKLPMMLDKDLRYDSSDYYNSAWSNLYTLVNYSADEIIKEEFKATQHKSLIKRNCTIKTTELFLKNGISLRFIYRGKNGKHIVDIILKPEDCGY